MKRFLEGLVLHSEWLVNVKKRVECPEQHDCHIDKVEEKCGEERKGCPFECVVNSVPL